MKLKLIAASLLSTLMVFVFATAPATAAFDKSEIMSDNVFNNKSSMTASQINNFLNSFPNSCISPDSTFRAKEPVGYSPSTSYQYGNYVTAGTIIHSAAQAYDLNPQVLLATLQKEQSLVSGTAGCSKLRYVGAMGYGCPDGGNSYNYSGVSLYRKNGSTVTSVSGTCVNSASKAGFSQQVIRGAWLLKFGQQRSLGNINWAIIRGNWDNSDDLESCYSGPMTRGTHQRCPSGSAVYYDGYKTIDGQSVLIGTGATAGFYWYTPHFHGNENFVNIFEGWFGSTKKVLNFRLVSCGGDEYLIERYRPVKRELTDRAIREWGLEDAIFVEEDEKGCGYPTYDLDLDVVVQSRQSKKKYLLNSLNFHRLQSQTISNAWGLGSEYAAPVGDTPMIDGATINDLGYENKLPRLAKSANSSKVYLLNDGVIHQISGTPGNETYLDLIRGYDEVPMRVMSGEFLSELKTANGQGTDLAATFTVGSKQYIFDHGITREIDGDYIVGRWDQLGTLLDGPDLSSDVPKVIDEENGLTKGFKRDGRYYVIRVGGIPDYTTSANMAKFWDVYNEPGITHLLRGIILSSAD